MSTSEKILNIKTGKLENCTVGAGCRKHAHSVSSLKELKEESLGISKKWYVFDQNNSGGTFAEPAQYLAVEAVDYKDANELAEEAGAYFDSEFKIDCSCCGVRWTPMQSDEINEFSVFKSEKDAIAFIRKMGPLVKDSPFYMVVS